MSPCEAIKTVAMSETGAYDNISAWRLLCRMYLGRPGFVRVLDMHGVNTPFIAARSRNGEYRHGNMRLQTRHGN